MSDYQLGPALKKNPYIYNIRKQNQKTQCDWNGEIVSHHRFVSTAVQPDMVPGVFQLAVCACICVFFMRV